MRAEASAPCTVGNFGPGFDVFSLALARRGDAVALSVGDEDSVVVTGPGSERIPVEWSRNVVCAALDALREATGLEARLEVRVEKGMPPGSGLGSSASSAAAAVRAFTRLHSLSLSPEDALAAAGAGEAVATGGAHYDDVAAALYGGLVVVGGRGPDAVVRLAPPPLTLVVARPEVELSTKAMRALIPQELPRADIIYNMSQVARIVHACHAKDAPMLCRALEDRISAKHRGPSVPGFSRARVAALKAGAHGFILSGSGPATIAALPAAEDAVRVSGALADAYKAEGVDVEIFVTNPHPEVNDPALPLH